MRTVLRDLHATELLTSRYEFKATYKGFLFGGGKILLTDVWLITETECTYVTDHLWVHPEFSFARNYTCRWDLLKQDDSLLFKASTNRYERVNGTEDYGLYWIHAVRASENRAFVEAQVRGRHGCSLEAYELAKVGKALLYQIQGERYQISTYIKESRRRSKAYRVTSHALDVFSPSRRQVMTEALNLVEGGQELLSLIQAGLERERLVEVRRLEQAELERQVAVELKKERDAAKRSFSKNVKELGCVKEKGKKVKKTFMKANGFDARQVNQLLNVYRQVRVESGTKIKF
jgi:hypothetical protein